MIRVLRYDENYRAQWDEFITKSKNGLFLFYRSYMEYHADRFTDHSLLFFDDHKMIAVMPANSSNNTLCSHGGLTFGGIISDQQMKTPLMLEVFSGMREQLLAGGFKELIYKAIPHIYHTVPAEEDLYGLFIHNAVLVRREISSTADMQQKVAYSKGRKGMLKKSQNAGLEVRQSQDFKTFMAIEEANLRQKYGVEPTHKADEMEMLAGRFPENIKLFAAYRSDSMLTGIVIYESTNVAHAQYIAATELGKEVGALDLIIDFLMSEHYLNKKYFDFGISTEKEGRYLNEGLIQNKEGFGARATVYDSYKIDLSK